MWSHLSDSNRRPMVYKTIALSTELRWHFQLEKSKSNRYYLERMNKTQPEPTDKPKVSFADDKKYTVESLAAELGYSTKTVYGWIKKRNLKATQFKGSRKIIITASNLNEFRDEYNTLKHWLSSIIAELDPAELDPAHVTETPVELDFDSLTEKQILSAYMDPAIIAELVDQTDSPEPKPKTAKADEFDPNLVDWINEFKKS